MKLSVISAEFRTDRERRGCNVATVTYYAKLTRWMCAYLEAQGVTDVEAVTPSHLEGYVADLRARPISKVTVRKRVLSLKTFWLWVAGRGYVATDPCRLLPVPKSPQRLPKSLTPDQARRLLATPMPVRERAAICLMLDTGIRVGECAALDVADLDPEQMTLLIRMGKGGRQRMVVYADDTRAALRAWLRVRDSSSPALFVTEHASGKTQPGDRLSRFALYKAIKRVAEDAGLSDKVSPHKLRHTCATLSLNNGAQLQDVSKLLGHSDIATTMIYTHVATDVLREHHRSFSPMKGLKQRGRDERDDFDL